MTTQKVNHQSTIKDNRLTTLSSRNELPIIQSGQNLLIDARLLHQQLKVGRDFSNWIKARIEEFGFKLGEDFFSGVNDRSPNLASKRGGHNRIDVHLTIDMAKELAMVERNEIGRNIRRYFIQKEKEARGISQLPREIGLFKGMKAKRFNDRLMYPYREILVRCGYKPNSNGNRKHRYWMHFVKDGSILYVTEDFSLHLFRQKQVFINRSTMLASQPVLPLNFGDVAQLKGGKS